uniref:NB-ARC domain-containing protein n=1 Tax=Oryza nivara TaxID=4536 RepID=A0A0E0J211_ORYNI
MAGLFASMAIEGALDSLSSLLQLQANPTPPVTTAAAVPPVETSHSSVKGELEDLRALEGTMRRIHATLRDAEQRWNTREKSAKLRLEEIKELAYDAEEVVDEYQYEVTRRKVEATAAQGGGGGDGASSSSSRKRKIHKVRDEDYFIEAGIVPVPRELTVRARKVIQRFGEIEGYYGSFTLSENDGDRRIIPDINSLRQTSSFVFAPIIVGRDQDKENVIKKMMTLEGSRIGGCISVLAIVGMGGLGKTTLAQLVYNDPKVRQAFDLFGWVCVSEHFDVNNVTRKILSSIAKKNCDYIQSSELQGQLENLIKDKRVFLVLDDVWNERSDCWKLLCMPIFASTRCDIIVTTRNEAVARLVQTIPFYNLDYLNPDDSWLLFKQTAFVEQDNNVSPANLVEIGQRIAKKCKGLPLALKTLGSVLRFEANSELWDLERSQNEVLPALELSYKHMPMHLKLCFVSLSLYPKDTYFDESIVVWLWKSLHLLQCDGTDNNNEIGGLYFTQLVQRSLIQQVDTHGRMAIHDLVHDLACFLAGEEFFRLEEDGYVEIPKGARYMSIVPHPQCKRSTQISNASQSLRVIILIRRINIENPEALFMNCKKFRIIQVIDDSFANVLLDFMGDMKLLRHFRLLRSCNEVKLVISDSMSQQFNLQTLNCEGYSLHGIGRLANLQNLPNIHLWKCGCYLRELRNMNKIRKLHICGLRNVSSIQDVNEAHLHSKKDLEILELDFKRGGFCEVHKEETDVNQAIGTVSGGSILESLRPHHQSLKVLRMKNLNEANYPSWLGSASFSKLTKLRLENCQSQHLPTLGELPSLKSIDIRQMEYVENIGREFCSLDPSVKGFRSLAHLRFQDVNRFSEWSEVHDGEFSSLETLLIWSASELSSLPSVPFSSLRSFELCDCKNLVTFPASATLQILSISSCEKLKELPALPSLRSVKLSGCESLVAVGHFPSLTVLHMSTEFEEEALHKLMNLHLKLEELSISSDTMKLINLEPHSLPLLRELELVCPNLQNCDALASLSSLKILRVNRCSPQLRVPNSLQSQLEKLYSPGSL